MSCVKYISSSSLINKNVKFGASIVIEKNCIIGHPEIWETTQLKSTDKILDMDTIIEKFDTLETLIDDNSYIRSGTIIYEGTHLGKNLQCAHNVIIRSNCVIGENVFIKSNTEIMRDVKIGNNCRIAGIIADGTIIEDNVNSYGILTHKVSKGIINKKQRKDAPYIQKDVFIGRNAVILGKIIIGKGSIIGANAFIDKDIPEYSFVIGNNIIQNIN